MAAPVDTIQPLEREDRVTKIRTFSRYVMVLLLVLMVLLLVQTARTSGLMARPFFMPLWPLLFVILGFCLIANAAIIAADTLELRWTADLRKRVWRTEDFMANARPLVVVTLVLAVLFFSPAIQGLIRDLGTSSDSVGVDAGSSYRLRFSPSDPLAVTMASSFESSTDSGVLLRGIIVKESDYNALMDADFEVEDPNVTALVKWHSASDGPALSCELDGLKLEYAEYNFVIYNPSNSSATVQYKLEREISAPFLLGLTWLSVGFFGVNLAWAIALYVMKKKTVAEFVQKEQQRLMRTYTIEEVFLIYKDGRLICHNTRRLKPDLDKDVLTGMLTAVQCFVRDSFSGEEKGVLNELKYGNLKILMENGPRANLAVVISGTGPANLRGHMRSLLDAVHLRYMPTLDDWDGDVTAMRELKKYIGQLVPEEKKRQRTEVEEIFLMFRDNRFMMHLSQRGQPDVDDTLLNQLLDTVRERVGQNLASASSSPLFELPYGNWKVVLEYGVQIYLAALISGTEPSDLRSRMRSVIAQLSVAHEKYLAEWDGNTDRLAELRPALEALFVESLTKAKGKSRWK